MTIAEAIKHCEKVAEELEKKANIYEIKNTYLPDLQKPVNCLSCAADHRQLAEWLRELKEAKRLLQLAITDFEKAGSCSTCARQSKVCDFGNCKYIWQYKDEVEKLIRGI